MMKISNFKINTCLVNGKRLNVGFCCNLGILQNKFLWRSQTCIFFNDEQWKQLYFASGNIVNWRSKAKVIDIVLSWGSISYLPGRLYPQTCISIVPDSKYSKLALLKNSATSDNVAKTLPNFHCNQQVYFLGQIRAFTLNSSMLRVLYVSQWASEQCTHVCIKQYFYAGKLRR